MSLSAINNGSQYAAIMQIRQTISADMQNALTKANSDNGNPLGTTVDFSSPSKILSSLTQLENQDPAKFKAVLNEAAGILKQEAGTASAAGPTSGRRCPVCVGCGQCANGSASGAIGTSANSASNVLNMLSQKLSSVAESGDLSQLLPTSGNNSGTGGAYSYAAAQYDLNGGNQQSLLDLLTQQTGQNTSASSTASGTNGALNSVRNLLTQALQQLA